MQCSLTVARHTLTKAQIYQKKFTSHFSAPWSKAQVLIPFDRRCRKHSTCSPWGDARLLWHVRLIHLAVSPQQSRQHQNIVWICSQGQEGKLLAAAQATLIDGMCSTLYLILVLVLSGERGGKAADAAQRSESRIRRTLRWAERETVSSAREKTQSARHCGQKSKDATRQPSLKQQTKWRNADMLRLSKNSLSSTFTSNFLLL